MDCNNSELVGNECLAVADFENISNVSNGIRSIEDCRNIIVEADGSEFK